MKAYDIIDNKKLLTLLFYQNEYGYLVGDEQDYNLDENDGSEQDYMNLDDDDKQDNMNLDENDDDEQDEESALLKKKILFLISKKYDFINLKNIPYLNQFLNIYLDNLEAYISKLEELIDNDHYYRMYKDQAMKVFQMIDKNSDGLLSTAEIRRALDNNHKIQGLFDLPAGRFQGPNILENEDKFARMISIMDRDGDHKISQDEFIEMYPILKRNKEDRMRMSEDVDTQIENRTKRRKSGGTVLGKRKDYENELKKESFENVTYLIKKIDSVIKIIKKFLPDHSKKVVGFIKKKFSLSKYKNNYIKFEMRSDIDEKIKFISNEFYTKKIHIRYLSIEDGCANMEEDRIKINL